MNHASLNSRWVHLAAGVLLCASASRAAEYFDETKATTIFAFRRGPNAIAYVIVAATADEALSSLKRIAALPRFVPGWMSAS